MEDPDLLDRLRDALERGMLYLMSIDGQKQIHPRPNPRGSQIRTVRDQARFRISRINLINMAFESWGGAGRDRNLVLDSSVRATFHEGALDSISYVAKSEPKVKQITLSIPKDDFEALRREAAELGVSVSALCSRWIRERVVSHQPHS